MILVIILALVLLVGSVLAGVYQQWWLLGVLATIELLVVAYLVIGIVAIKMSLYVKRRTYDDVLSQDKKFGIPSEVSVLPYEEVRIKGSEGYEMVASYMKARGDVSHEYFIICHGYNSNRVTCNKYANVLLDLGFNTLCPDMRRCGETGGKGITFGYKESEDIKLWIKYLRDMDKDAKISLYGISLGAASSVMVASEDKDIEYLISYCSFASFDEIIMDRMLHSKVPAFLAKMLIPFIKNYIGLAYGNKKANTDIVDCIKKVECPTLIMHSNGDRFTNIEHAYKLRQAKPDATFVEFDGAPHARAYGVYPEEYASVLRDFITAVRSDEVMEDRYITKTDGEEIAPTSKEDDNLTL